MSRFALVVVVAAAAMVSSVARAQTEGVEPYYMMWCTAETNGACAPDDEGEIAFAHQGGIRYAYSRRGAGYGVDVYRLDGRRRLRDLDLIRTRYLVDPEIWNYEYSWVRDPRSGEMRGGVDYCDADERDGLVHHSSWTAPEDWDVGWCEVVSVTRFASTTPGRDALYVYITTAGCIED